MTWPALAIGEIAQVNPKLAPAHRPHLDDTVSFVPMAAVSEESTGIAVHEERRFSEVSKGYTPFMRGDILVAKITPCFENGKMALAEDLPHEFGFGTTEFHVFRPTEGVTGPYLFNLLRVPWLRDAGAMRMRGAAGQRRVPADFFASVEIPVPPLAEQKRIAGILDATDALRTKRREAIAQLDILLQSVFLDMFGDPVTNPMGWEVRRLADVAEFHAGSSLPAGEDFVGQDGGYLNLKVSDLNEPENTTRIVSSKLWSTDRGKGIVAPERATVFPKRGGAIGTNKKRLLDRAAVLDPNLMAVSASEWLHHLFLYRWFFTFDLVDITSGSTVPQLNKRDLSPLPIQVPPIHLQRRFAAMAESIEQQKTRQRAHLTELDTLFASLQSRAFRGDL